MKDPERQWHLSVATRLEMPIKNFLTRCINQEIVVTQRVHHVGMGISLKLGVSQEPTFIQTDFVKRYRWLENGALTEDTDISFKIMQSGKLIALAYNSEAFNKNLRL